MFRKLKLKRQIKACQKEIQALEKRRIRSQAALVEAILTNSVPSDEDVDYFNTFTARIQEVREQMHSYQKELNEGK